MRSQCEGCGAPSPEPGEPCRWCGAHSVEVPQLTAKPQTPAPSPAPAPGHLAESPSGLRVQRAKPWWQRGWEAFEARVYAHSERHPLPGKLIFIGFMASPVVLALGFTYGGWFSEPEPPEVERPLDYRYAGIEGTPPSRTDPEVALAGALKAGDVVVLTNERAPGHRGDPIPVFPTRAALEQVGEAAASKNRSDLWRALEAGFDVPEGTRARIFNPYPKRLYAEVRVLDGLRENQAGWVPTVQIRR